MKQVRAVFVLLFVGLGVVYSLASAQGSSFLLVRALTSRDPMTWALFGDLYVGLALMTVWMMAQEKTLTRSLPWLAAFVMFGNMATLVYLLFRTSRVSEEEMSWLFLPKGKGD